MPINHRKMYPAAPDSRACSFVFNRVTSANLSEHETALSASTRKRMNESAECRSGSGSLGLLLRVGFHPPVRALIAVARLYRVRVVVEPQQPVGFARANRILVDSRS